jgi:transcriptional regulator with XRE-family HTH domain
MDRVRELRFERGLSQAKLAARAGIDPSTVNQIETGKRSPSANSLNKLARALDVEVADLFPKGQSPLPLDDVAGAETELLRRVLDAVRQDTKRQSQTIARTKSSEGQVQAMTEFAEDKVRAELRAAGVPDELFERFIWPLATLVGRLEQENVRLEQENAEAKEHAKVQIRA